MWFKGRKDKAQVVPADGEVYVDLDRNSIPLGDDTDPTSLMFDLSMRYGPVHVDHDPRTGEAIVHVGGRTFTGLNDLSALHDAKDALDNS